MKKDNSVICLFGTYSALLLLTTLFCTAIIFIRLTKPAERIVETVVETDYVYVYLDDTTDVTETTTSTAEDFLTLIAREYEGKIGIFDSTDKLIQILDVNVSTLPEADRKLLRAGIKISSKAELNSLIEDYTD